MTREIACYTLEGVSGADISTHYFTTADKLGLHLTRFCRAPSRDVVLLVHCHSLSSDMFIMPEHYNLVQYLLDHGFSDVWALDSRMSNRYPYNLRDEGYSIDDSALHDFPAAVAKLRSIAPDAQIHVIGQGMGGMALLMSVFGKATTGIRSIVANSAGLTPRLPRWSVFKGLVLARLVELFFSPLDPRWGERRDLSVGRLIAFFNSLGHRECDVPACHMVSFIFGAGRPALFVHDNLHPVTHRRVGDLFGATHVRYMRHVLKMHRSGNRAVKWRAGNPRQAQLPDDYLRDAADIETPVLAVMGEHNRVFGDSNALFHQRLEELAPGRHEFQKIPGYGHIDVFLGKNAHVDVFPRLLQFLERHRAVGTAARGASAAAAPVVAGSAVVGSTAG